MIATLLPLPSEVAEILAATARMRARFPQRRFTLDGHLVGDIGEVIAADSFGLTLLPASYKCHDAIDPDGRSVQIKMTGGNSVSLYSDCDRLLILRITADGQHAEVVYDGPGAPAWSAAGTVQKNGQRKIRLSRLRKIAAEGARQWAPMTSSA